jgi:hypothetical protein
MPHESLKVLTSNLAPGSRSGVVKNRVIRPCQSHHVSVIRSWLSGKTLDRDFTFSGDEIMTYMPARGSWFDTRKPHSVTLVRWQKGA